MAHQSQRALRLLSCRCISISTCLPRNGLASLHSHPLPPFAPTPSHHPPQPHLRRHYASTTRAIAYQEALSVEQAISALDDILATPPPPDAPQPPPADDTTTPQRKAELKSVIAGYRDNERRKAIFKYIRNRTAAHAARLQDLKTEFEVGTLAGDTGEEVVAMVRNLVELDRESEAPHWTPEQRGELLGLMMLVEGDLKFNERLGRGLKWARTLVLAGALVAGIGYLEGRSR